jgi:hypothetical protein
MRPRTDAENTAQAHHVQGKAKGESHIQQKEEADLVSEQANNDQGECPACQYEGDGWKHSFMSRVCERRTGKSKGDRCQKPAGNHCLAKKNSIYVHIIRGGQTEGNKQPCSGQKRNAESSYPKPAMGQLMWLMHRRPHYHS